MTTNSNRVLVLAAITICMAYPSLLHSQSVNLLSLEQTTLVEDEGIALSDEVLLRDGSPESKTPVHIEAGQQLEIVYLLDSETVTVEDSAISLPGLEANKATVEILASTQSPASGFRSLCVAPNDGMKAGERQYFRFEPSAARWVIIRIIPTDKEKPLSFSIAEIELNGYVGSPKSTYLFSESPADALNVLARLSDTVELNLTEDEKKLFEDASDGQLDETTFAEASLLSSGITDQSQRESLIALIDQFEAESRTRIPEDLSPFERGEKLLEWLHAGPLSHGYLEKQTDVAVVLSKQQYNCVSSATLNNILARRLGLDARGIEVPDHAFSILYDGTSHVDIETTNPLGFNPARNRQGIQQFQQATGFVYIPESNRSQRREVRDMGMVALTYYNHGVTALSEKRHSDAMVAFFKSLSLDSGNKSAVKAILTSLGNWSHDLYESGDVEMSLAVLEVGRELAHDDRALKHHQRVVWQLHIKSLVESGDVDTALEQLSDAYTRTQNDELAELQSRIFVMQGQSLVEAKNWPAAIESVDNGLKLVDEKARKELMKWRQFIVLSWSSELHTDKKYSDAVDVVEIGLSASSDWRLDKRLAFLAQEWSRQETDARGAQAGYDLINELAQRFPDSNQLGQVSSSLASRTANEYLESEDYESALKVFQAALESNPDNWRIEKNLESIWNIMARPHMDARRWEQAADIYERAYKSMPSAFGFQQNLAYVVQELGSDTLKENGVVAAEEAIAAMAERFPDINGVQKLRGSRISREVKRMINEGEYDAAKELLLENRTFWRYEHEFDKVANGAFYVQAKPHMDSGDWETAIEIFAQGYKSFPDNRHLKSNLEYGWLSKAEVLLDGEKWDEALAVYKAAALSLPDSHKIKNNIHYCESQIEKASGK